MLTCLVSPSDGSGRVAGYDVVRDASRVRETVGVLTENPSLYERLTAYENMDFFAEAYNLTNLTEKQTRIKALLQFFDLWDRRNDRVAKFSRGMKQKLAIARALVHNPPILFLDEPTTGLDPESAKGIRDLMESLSRHEKHTILLSTHHLEDAERLCNRVMIINRGRSVIVGSPDELRDKITGEPVIKIALVRVDQRIIDAVKGLEHVKEVALDDSAATLAVTVDHAKSATPEIVRSIVHADGKILSVNVQRPSLEDAYLRLVRGEST
jgi:ABC-2 type transport system ATP-binding protein